MLMSERRAQHSSTASLSADRDKAFVVQFARQIDLLQDVTASKVKLEAAVKQLDTPPASSRDTSSVSDPRDTSSNKGHAGDATLYDATFLASSEVIGKQKGSKVLVVLSDIDRGIANH